MNNKFVIFIATFFLIIFVIVVSVMSSDNQNNNKNNQSVINRNSKVEDIVFEDEKVNIYFFWGNGCPHCEDQFEFLESINEEYSKYYNIYCFEVWYNDDNANLMVKFADKMGDRISGVPYTIVGEKSIGGFSSSIKSDFKNMIINQHNKDFDVYKELK